MKFCNSCGKQLAETAVFCDGCGAKMGVDLELAVKESEDSVVSQTVARKELTENQEREKVLEQMYVCYDAVLAIGVAHDELTNMEEKVEEQKRDHEKCEKRIQELRASIERRGFNPEGTFEEQSGFASIAKLASLAWLIFGGIIGVVFTILGLFSGGGFESLYYGLLTFVICGFFIAIQASFNYVGVLKDFKRDMEELDRLLVERGGDGEFEQELKINEDKIHSLQQALQKICEEESSRFMMEYLPKDYCNLDAISSFITYLENKRADTFKEAINVYEDEKHKSKMQEMQQVSVDKLNTQSKMMAMSIEQQAQWQKENAQRQERMIANSQKINEEIRFGNAVSVINLVDRWEQEGRLK